MKYLIVGLGNPGPQYELTRHNVGFLTLDRFAEQQSGDFSQERLGDLAECKVKGKSIYLLKPNTFMNRSGKAVNYWLQQLKVGVENLLVITDDIALPFGKLRMRAKGSSAGHNGLRDIEAVLGGNAYARLRFGIGSDFPKGRQIDYVLGRFPEIELAELPEHMDRAGEMIIGFATIGIERTMSQYNS
ncbi:MAG: aminoacyl-tRNA hydrolase [Cyclobacteriaceae bacterium]